MYIKHRRGCDLIHVNRDAFWSWCPQYSWSQIKRGRIVIVLDRRGGVKHKLDIWGDRGEGIKDFPRTSKIGYEVHTLMKRWELK